MMTRLKRVKLHLINGQYIEFDSINNYENIDHYIVSTALAPYYQTHNIETNSGVLIPKSSVVMIEYEHEDADVQT